jgi:7,8-dihydropterin-6-yl-methyl-4-(beta-D-ribofuranosyl)aminobenzene 5'-phosphate synthase
LGEAQWVAEGKMLTTKQWIRLSVSLWLLAWSTGTASAQDATTISITVLYDNYASVEGLNGDLGFSCLIEGMDRAILFDTGRVPHIFRKNIAKIGPNLKTVEHVVISHNHRDHVGGLLAFLEEHPDVSVYLPPSFPKRDIEAIRATGAAVVTVKTPMKISQHALLTGEIRTGSFDEHALVIQTANEVVVVVGCAHPGLVTIVQKAQEMTNQKVSRVIGGFHLLHMSDEGVLRIIKQLKKLGVERVGPTHCTGDRAIKLFKDAYGEQYIPMGVGYVQTISLGKR